MDTLIALIPLMLMIILYICVVVFDEDGIINNTKDDNCRCVIDNQGLKMFDKNRKLIVRMNSEDGSTFFNSNVDITNGVNFEQKV